MNWVHLVTEPDQIAAEMLVERLRAEGIAAMIRPSDAASFLGVAAIGCRVQVAEEDLERARQILGDEAPDE